MAANRTTSPFTGADRLLEPGVLDQARLGWRLFRDPRVPWVKNVIPAFAALYLISPIDPIPDFLIGLGQVDDLGMLIALTLATIRWLPRMAPRAVVEEHLADLQGKSEPPRRTADPDGPTYEARYRLRDEERG